MKRGMKFLSTMGLVLAVAWVALPSETAANCGFNSIFASGGLANNPVPQYIDSPAFLGGHAWKVGSGDPADGAGNDLTSLIGGPAVGADRPFIRRTDNGGNPLPGAAILWDWAQVTDGCIGTDAGVGEMAAFVQAEGGGDYLVVAVTGTLGVGHDFDRAGPMALAPFSLTPKISVLSVDSDFAVTADVAPASASANCVDDSAGALCAQVIATGTELVCGGAGTGCMGDGTGCTGISLPRDAGGNEGECCWDTNAQVVASSVPGTSICQAGPLIGTICDPSDPGNFCDLLGGPGACPPATPTIVPWATIPAGCTVIAGPSVSDVVLVQRAAFNGNSVSLRWAAEQFTITHFDIIGIKNNGKSGSVGQVLRQGSNDGSLQDYELTLSRGDVKGANTFVLRTFLTDGTSFDTTFE